MDFPLSHCQTIVATHADVDHSQGLAKAKQAVADHRDGRIRWRPRVPPAATRLFSFAEIPAQQGIHLEMPPVQVERDVDEGDRLRVADMELAVWLHARATPTANSASAWARLESPGFPQ